MSDRLAAAVAELVEALRDEMRAEMPRDPGPERLLSVEEACRALGGISRTTFYGMADRGELRTLKAGGRRLIPQSAIAELANKAEP